MEADAEPSRESHRLTQTKKSTFSHDPTIDGTYLEYIEFITLQKIGLKKEIPLCIFCTDGGDWIEHMLFVCPVIQEWSSVTEWLAGIGYKITNSQ